MPRLITLLLIRAMASLTSFLSALGKRPTRRIRVFGSRYRNSWRIVCPPTAISFDVACLILFVPILSTISLGFWPVRSPLRICLQYIFTKITFGTIVGRVSWEMVCQTNIETFQPPSLCDGIAVKRYIRSCCLVDKSLMLR